MSANITRFQSCDKIWCDDGYFNFYEFFSFFIGILISSSLKSTGSFYASPHFLPRVENNNKGIAALYFQGRGKKSISCVSQTDVFWRDFCIWHVEGGSVDERASESERERVWSWANGKGKCASKPKTNWNQFCQKDSLIQQNEGEKGAKKDEWAKKGKFITLKVHKSLMTRRHTKLLLSRH